MVTDFKRNEIICFINHNNEKKPSYLSYSILRYVFVCNELQLI